MKKIFTLLSFSFIALLGNATIHFITVGTPTSNVFNPANITAVCGDTVIWQWGAGSHTTTSTNIPACATAWNANINSTSTVYAITIPCAGTYSYQCTPHAAMGMVGTIVATCTNNVPIIASHYFSAAYPNPFSSKLTIETSQANLISIYNAVGENIKSIAVPQGQIKTEIDMQDLQAGIYFYAVLKEGVIIETKKIVKQ
ncbi:MAG: T9SS type A sorting domain-containing protein [Bacteroidetes bacterium]|nr:T9SS type A sorting domain-containing protein [Bacteroidota bacterium]